MLIISLQSAESGGDGQDTLLSLGVALLFAALFLFVRRKSLSPGRKRRDMFLSFAAGISVAYVFVHVLPALHQIRDYHAKSATGFQSLFPEYSVYLWTMAGFLVFSGLDVLDARLSGTDGPAPGRAGWWLPRIEIGGFALYTWLLTYLMVWTGKGSLALALYAVAMGMHLFPIAWNLRTHYPDVYEGHGAFLLAGASLTGWACALTLNISSTVVLNLVAFVAGGVIVNGAIAELHEGKHGRYGSFLLGTASYTALLLTMSHFER